MRVLDLFSGIGGFSLGLERAGFETVAFCENDLKCRRVLNKHWPNVPIFFDVKRLTHKVLERYEVSDIDVICGGFPCTDISIAGKGAGIEGKQSGLWSEFARLISEIRPKYAIIENVEALRFKGKGLYRVLGDLAEVGYDAEWHCIPASSVGAPHQRDRIWVIAYATSERQRNTETEQDKLPEQEQNSTWKLCRTKRIREQSDDVSNSDSTRCEGWRLSGGKKEKKSMPGELCKDVSNAQGEQNRRILKQELFSDIRTSGWWQVEPSVGRVVDGVPGRVDRLKQLGNAVVPQIPELIGRAILEYERASIK